MSHISPIKQRLRITFGKHGPLKYTSNLDIAKIWERVLRRANLPILYTQGFNTRPRIQLAMALPLGITSNCEILDVALRDVIEINEQTLTEQILAVSPTGLSINKIVEAPPTGPALQTLVRSAKYRIVFEDGIDTRILQEKVDAILEAENIMLTKQRKRKTTTYDMRPLVLGLRVEEDTLLAHLSVGERGNLRPDILIEHMGLQDEYHHVHRYELLMVND